MYIQAACVILRDSPERLNSEYFADLWRDSGALNASVTTSTYTTCVLHIISDAAGIEEVRIYREPGSPAIKW